MLSLLDQAPFDSLTDEEKEFLIGKAKLFSFSRDDILYDQGKSDFSPIYVLSGQVKLSCTASHGRECVLHIIRPKALIDAAVLFYEKNLPYSAFAIGEGQAILFDRANFLDLITKNNSFSGKLFRMMSMRQRLLINKLVGSQGRISVSCRVASWLLHRCRMEGTDILSIDITRELLARLLGVTRESLSRELSRLNGLGYIAVARRSVHILEKAALQKIAVM